MAALQTKVAGITLLADPALTTIRMWGALLPGAEHPSPVTFVVNKDRQIRYRHPLDVDGDWPRYSDLAAALDR